MAGSVKVEVKVTYDGKPTSWTIKYSSTSDVTGAPLYFSEAVILDGSLIQVPSPFFVLENALMIARCLSATEKVILSPNGSTFHVQINPLETVVFRMEPANWNSESIYAVSSGADTGFEYTIFPA